MTDTFLTIASPSQGTYTEKRSKFLAFAFPVSTVEEIKALIEEYQKKYYDARHACYAYMLGHERLVFRANDNDEPSGTAGKPILGQINSNELTEAIAAATIIQKTVDEQICISFEYPLMNQVMRIVKEESPTIVSQSFEGDCLMTLSIRASLMPRLHQRLDKVDGVTITSCTCCR